MPETPAEALISALSRSFHAYVPPRLPPWVSYWSRLPVRQAGENTLPDADSRVREVVPGNAEYLADVAPAKPAHRLELK
jgi:hypothetical protein